MNQEFPQVILYCNRHYQFSYESPDVPDVAYYVCLIGHSTHWRAFTKNHAFLLALGIERPIQSPKKNIVNRIFEIQWIQLIFLSMALLFSRWNFPSCRICGNRAISVDIDICPSCAKYYGVHHEQA